MKKTFATKDRDQHKQGEKINKKEKTEEMHQEEIKTPPKTINILRDLRYCICERTC